MPAAMLQRWSWTAAARALAALAAGGLLALAANSAQARDLVASIASSPNQSDSPDSGPFVELVKAIDDAYTEGSIERRVVPFVRSLEHVVSGVADFHIPMLHNPGHDTRALRYRFASEKLGDVEYVLYSNVSEPLTLEMIRGRQRSGRAPHYRIATLQGAQLQFFDFPVELVRASERSELIGLRRVAVGHLDALLAPQEQTDAGLRELRLSTVQRAPGLRFDSVIAIAKGPAGDAVDAIVSEAIRSLKASGRWQALFSRVHRPYDEWQPAREFAADP